MESSEELLAELKSLRALVQSSAQIVVPEWAREVLDDLQPSSSYIVSVPLMRHGYNSLRVDFLVERAGQIRLTISSPNGARMGSVVVTRE